jgi:hypothetical protein
MPTTTKLAFTSVLNLEIASSQMNEMINMHDMLPLTPVRGYSARSTNLGISKVPPNANWLVFEAISGQAVLYMVSLFELNHNELKLAEGRFRNFQLAQKKNEVIHNVSYSENYAALLRNQIEWVADATYDTHQTWAFSIEAHHVNHMAHHFFFSDEELAIHFKLFWS